MRAMTTTYRGPASPILYATGLLESARNAPHILMHFLLRSHHAMQRLYSAQLFIDAIQLWDRRGTNKSSATREPFVFGMTDRSALAHSTRLNRDRRSTTVIDLSGV